MAKKYQNYNGVYRPVFYLQLWFYLGLALVADLSLFALKQILMILKKDTTTLTMIIYSILFYRCNSSFSASLFRVHEDQGEDMERVQKMMKKAKTRNH